jgi:hypothetical protein
MASGSAALTLDAAHHGERAAAAIGRASAAPIGGRLR